jgi:hypothetical protein
VAVLATAAAAEVLVCVSRQECRAFPARRRSHGRRGSSGRKCQAGCAAQARAGRWEAASRLHRMRPVRCVKDCYSTRHLTQASTTALWRSNVHAQNGKSGESTLDSASTSASRARSGFRISSPRAGAAQDPPGRSTRSARQPRQPARPPRINTRRLPLKPQNGQCASDHSLAPHPRHRHAGRWINLGKRTAAASSSHRLPLVSTPFVQPPRPRAMPRHFYMHDDSTSSRHRAPRAAAISST